MNPAAVESCAECGRPPDAGEIGWAPDAGKYLCHGCVSWRNGDTPHLHAVDEHGESMLEILTAADLCALPDPPKSHELVGQLLGRGERLVLGGHSGEGKSSFSLQLVKAVATGEDFLDWKAAKGRALVIDAEQGLRTVKRRLREAGLDSSTDVDYLRAPDGLALDSDDKQAAAVESVLAGGDYALVLLDPLYKLQLHGDSSEERAAVDLMRRFDRWRETYGFALVLCAHCRKPQPGGAKFSMHELFGSSAFLRGAEVVLGLQRLSDGYAKVWLFKHRDGCDWPTGGSVGLLFDREHGFRRNPDDRAAKQTAAERVRDLLSEEGGQTKERLAEITGYKERTIQKALHEIGAEDFRVGKRGQKRFFLPADVQHPDDGLAEEERIARRHKNVHQLEGVDFG